MGSPLLVVAVRVNLWDIMNEGPCVSSFNGSSTEIPQWWFVLLMNKVLSDKVQPRSDVWQVLGPASALDLSAVFLCFCQACSDLALSVGVLDPEARTGKLRSSRTKSSPSDLLKPAKLIFTPVKFQLNIRWSWVKLRHLTTNTTLVTKESAV